MATIALNRELPPSLDFDGIRQQAKSVWNKIMSRFELPGDDSKVVTFWRCLYRALLFPRRLGELDEDNNLVHYSPYDPRGGV